MEPTLGLLSGSGGGPGGGGGAAAGGTLGLSNEAAAASSAAPKMEKDYMMGTSSTYNEAELELGLGLSLSSSRSDHHHHHHRGVGAKGTAKGLPGAAAAWGGEYGRILTAKDFPNGFPSTVSGTKRAAADFVTAAGEVGSASTHAVSQVVGWPPIGVHRMNSLVNQAKIPSPDEGKGAYSNEKEESSKKKINHGNNKDDATQARGHLGFVKVYIDGLLFGRKVDLNAHSCYESLAKTLEEMFFKSSTSVVEKDLAKQPSKLLDGSSEFALTYEDKEGDWMLVGDVPWGMFLGTVKRLRIMKTSEATGLGPRSQERSGRQKGKAM